MLIASVRPSVRSSVCLKTIFGQLSCFMYSICPAGGPAKTESALPKRRIPAERWDISQNLSQNSHILTKNS